MTQNQIAYQAHLENVRRNREQEAETRRSNLAREEEINRANLAKESELYRSNIAKETETNRSNIVQESLKGRDLDSQIARRDTQNAVDIANAATGGLRNVADAGASIAEMFSPYGGKRIANLIRNIS